MKYPSKYNFDWQLKFAWFPTYVDCYQNKVWLEHYLVRFITDLAYKGELIHNIYNNIVGGWEYKSVNRIAKTNCFEIDGKIYNKKMDLIME